MKTFVLLRLILRTLRDFTKAATAIATELRTLNATANRLLLVAAKHANYFPAAPPPAEDKVVSTVGPAHFSDALTFAAAETVRRRLEQQLGREPLESEFLRELELELVTRARTQVVG